MKKLISILMLVALPALAQTPTWDIQFEWDSNCPAECGSVDGARIYMVGGGLIVDTTETGITVVSDYALDFGTEYCFQIEEYNVAGTSELSDPSCLTTPAQQAPGKPSLGS
jgi:hypothetical protein